MPRWLPCFLLFLSALGLHAAQISVKHIWELHDSIVINAKSTPPPEDPIWTRVDPEWNQVFVGKSGKKVLGWDMGPKEGTVILWFTGGPGGDVYPGEYLLTTSQSNVKYRHIILNQPGTGDGRSEWVPHWKPEDSADDAETFLKLRGISEPVIVAGWSWGSTMSLLFAQRHPELTRGVVVGGVWTNTAREVHYYLDPNGTRALIPGANTAFASVVGDGPGAAGRLHKAIRDGIGGREFAEAYAMCEGYQAMSDANLSEGFKSPAMINGSKVDMGRCTDMMTKFAYIESEMMWRGERGAWKLWLKFPKKLAQVPLIVIQGRYDQVCDPATAVRVYRAWPGSHKCLVTTNNSHGGYHRVTGELLKRVGLPDDSLALAKFRRAISLHLGNNWAMLEAGMEAIVKHSEP